MYIPAPSLSIPVSIQSYQQVTQLRISIRQAKGVAWGDEHGDVRGIPKSIPEGDISL